jgi:hypothetical protein
VLRRVDQIGHATSREERDASERGRTCSAVRSTAMFLKNEALP